LRVMSCGWHQNAQPAAQLSGQQLTAEEIRGRPKKTLRSTFREDLQARGVSWSEKETMAADRVRW